MGEQMDQMEMKTLSVKLDAGEEGKFTGYGAYFDNVDSWGDVIVKGAFEKAIEAFKSGSALPFLWQHWRDNPIGVFTDLAEDEKGLLVTGQIIADEDIPNSKYALKAVKNGLISGLSIGFIPVEYSFKEDEGAGLIRYLTEIELKEISLVTIPANNKARINDIKSVRDFESFLREAGGFSRSKAKEVASKGFRIANNLREEDSEVKETLKNINKLFTKGK